MYSIIKNIFFLLALVFVFASCEKTIEFDHKYIKSKIVVNSILSEGRGIWVNVEKSRSVLDDNDYYESLSGAKVVLFENGEILKELEFIGIVDTFYKHLEYGAVEKYPYVVGNYYDSTVVIHPGSTYKLEVSKDGFDPVTCETTVPVPIKLDTLVVNMKKAFQDYYDNYFEVNMQLTMNDPAEEENFYLVRTNVTRGIELALLNYGDVNHYGGYYGGGQTYYVGGGQTEIGDIDSIQPTDTIMEIVQYSDYLYSSDPVFTDNTNALDVLDGYTSIRTYFPDNLINGQNYKLFFNTVSFRDVYTDFGEYMNIRVIMENISKELYLYYLSREAHGLAIDNPFAEPVPVYSNVEGGLGIFGSVSYSWVHNLIGEYPIDGKTYIDQNTYNEIYNGYFY